MTLGDYWIAFDDIERFNALAVNFMGDVVADMIAATA